MLVLNNKTKALSQRPRSGERGPCVTPASTPTEGSYRRLEPAGLVPAPLGGVLLGSVSPVPGGDLGVHTPPHSHPHGRDGTARPPWPPLPVDTGLGRDTACRRQPEPSSVAHSSPEGTGAPHTVVSSADQGRQSPALVLGWGVAGSKAPRDEDRWSLHTDAQEVDREQEPPSLSS